MAPPPDHVLNIPLNALRAIYLVAQRGSLRAAATELGVTQGAVSQHIRRSEQRLGIRLFHRLPAGLEPTEHLVGVLPILGAAFQGLLSAVEQLQQRSRSEMTVSVGSVFASRFLTPRLPSFLSAYPDADLRLEISSSLTDLTRKEVDVGIRFGKGGWPGTRSVKLRESSLVLVCSPKLAQTLVSPAALTEVPIIHDVSTAEGWHDWLHQAGMDPGTVLKFVQTYSDPTLAIDAALNSNGVWLAVDIIVSDALKTGLLVEPTGIRVPATSHYWLVTAEGRKQPDLVRSFCRWLRSEASLKDLLPAGGEMFTPLSGG